jgi:DNA (cytosine-5)-methyltransferase 1
MRYVELFAGAGGMSHGLEAAGMTCVAHAEIDPHAQAVLRHHWPETPLHGDVTQVDWTQYAGRVDLVSGGSPCQDLSVAGKRAGLEGARSGLFFELIRAWDETRAPYCLWENVDGARSSNKGEDFAAVLSAFVGADVAVPQDGWRKSGVAAGSTGVAAWRVLDLQHFGPPQRRRRVFVVAARTGGVDPAEVLALSEGVCGHPSPRQQAREIAATSVGGGIDSSVAFHHTQTPISGSVSPAFGRTTNGMGVMAFPLMPQNSGKDYTGSGTPIVARMVAFGEYATDGTASTIKQRDYKDATDLVYAKHGRPRRLTPLECERLMSWPDQWTATGRKADGTLYALSDTARYRLCGNGVGSVCAQWIAGRFLDQEAT